MHLLFTGKSWYIITVDGSIAQVVCVTHCEERRVDFFAVARRVHVVERDG